MPQIKEYTQRVESAGPIQGLQATPDEFGAGIGRSLDRLGQGVSDLGGALVKREEQNEISDTHVAMAEAHANYTNKLKELVKNPPKDPEARKNMTQDFINSFDENTQAISDNVHTRAGKMFLIQSASTLRSHFVESAAAGQAEVASEQAQANVKKFVDLTSNAIAEDPGSFDIGIQQRDAFLAANQQAFGEKATNQLKESIGKEFAKAAIYNLAKLDPKLALEQLGSEKFDEYFDATTRRQLDGEIRQQETAKRLEEDRVRQADKRILEEKQQGTQKDFLKRMVDGDLSYEDILGSNLNAFGSGSQEAFIQLLKAHSEEKLKDDPNTVKQLWDVIHKPDGDPGKLTDENKLNAFVTGGKLTIPTLSLLREEINGHKTIEGQNEATLKKGFEEEVRNRLTKSNPFTGASDPEGDQLYNKFMVNFLNDYADKKAKGISPAKLLSPDSPDYLGRQLYQPGYQRSVKDMQKDAANRMRGPTLGPIFAEPGKLPMAGSDKKRKTGESVTDYLKRTK